MSRAFVKEPDGDAGPEAAPERPISPHPNYVRPQGLAALEAAVQSLAADRAGVAAAPATPGRDARLAAIDREVRYLQARIAGAIVTPPAAAPPDRVRFGTRVTVADPDGVLQTFTIVGEDEADVGAGRVSWVSPLARAVNGAEIGEDVTWRRPAGDLELVVVRIDWPDD
ncbi:MAG TPA: GreA/GreB family elongation factor [Myxococcota bacterium]|nr:GreA/GreB family elongation factor [Myxococcota bacterium]